MMTIVKLRKVIRSYAQTFSLPLILAAAGIVVVSASASPSETKEFTNSSVIALGPACASAEASPYPLPISVFGMAGTVTKVTVTLSNFTTSGSPDRIRILLVSPDSTKSVLLMAAAGGTNDVSGINLIFDDKGIPLPENGQILSDTLYEPTSYQSQSASTFDPPAPNPPFGTLLSEFNGIVPDGQWKLYVFSPTCPLALSIVGGTTLTITTTA
jgi:hypothetical protein